MFVSVPFDTGRITSSSFWDFCESIARLNTNSFSLTDFTKFESKRVRSNLRYLAGLGILERTNEHYEIASSPKIQLFFRLLRRDFKQAVQVLRSYLLGHKELKMILDNILTYPSSITTTEFAVRLQEMDNKSENTTYYTKGARFLAGLLSQLGVVQYEPYKRIVKRHQSFKEEQRTKPGENQSRQQDLLADSNILVIRYKGVDLSFVPKNEDVEVMKEVLKLYEALGKK